jgi:hypothetical protein
MATQIKCPKGHWFTPDARQKTNRCPVCKAETQLGKKAISEDDVLAFLDSPKETSPAATSEDEPISEILPVEEHKSLHGPAILRRNKKICPRCSHETSVSFEHCPRCGEPLKVVSTELP